MRKTVVTLILLVAVVTSCFAFSFSPSIQGYVGGNFCHPTSKYLKTIQGKTAPFFRTSFDVGMDALLANFTLKKTELGFGFALQWTSRSLAAGISVLQPYLGTGMVVGLERRFESGFGLGFKARLMMCKTPLKFKFDTLDFEINPSKRFFNGNNFEISLITPVCFTYKNDSVSVRLNVGFDLQYDIVFKGHEQQDTTETAQAK